MEEITHAKIIDYIVNAGRKVTSNEIRDTFKIHEATSGNLSTRMIIKEAIKNYAVDNGYPIGADGRGYFFNQIKS